MSKIINVGVIGNELFDEFFQSSESDGVEKFLLKKIFVDEPLLQNIKKTYPETEIVNDVNAIVNDSSIELVIVSANHLPFVKQVIQSGKAVRVI